MGTCYGASSSFLLETSFHLEVSIAQILVAVLTCALLDLVIVARRERVRA